MRWFGGHSTLGEAARPWNAGAVVSRTVTVKAPVAELPQPSVAVAVTIVTPSGNRLPGGGSKRTATSPSRSSIAEPEKATTAPSGPVASVTRSAGRVRTGGRVSGS